MMKKKRIFLKLRIPICKSCTFSCLFFYWRTRGTFDFLYDLSFLLNKKDSKDEKQVGAKKKR